MGDLEEQLLLAIRTDEWHTMQALFALQPALLTCMMRTADPASGLPVWRTPLQLAASWGCHTVLAGLLRLGCPPNDRAPVDGYTALHCAVLSSRTIGGLDDSVLRTVALLMQAGGDPNSVDAVGRTPLQLILGGPQPAISSPADAGTMFRAPNDLLGSTDKAAGTASPLSEDFDTPTSELMRPEYLTDDFRCFVFKVADCARQDAHDWTECPFAHPGEKARRRHPGEYQYSSTPCPDFRKGNCKRGDGCPYAHGVFEAWLHPTKYRTQLCKDGPGCTRSVCFFAHHLSELRTPSDAAQQKGKPSVYSHLRVALHCGATGPKQGCAAADLGHRCSGVIIGGTTPTSSLDLGRLPLLSEEDRGSDDGRSSSSGDGCARDSVSSSSSSSTCVALDSGACGSLLLGAAGATSAPLRRTALAELQQYVPAASLQQQQRRCHVGPGPAKASQPFVSGGVPDSSVWAMAAASLQLEAQQANGRGVRQQAGDGRPAQALPAGQGCHNDLPAFLQGYAAQQAERTTLLARLSGAGGV